MTFKQHMKPVVTLDDVQDDEEQASKKMILSFLIYNPATIVSVLRENRQQEDPAPRQEVVTWRAAPRGRRQGGGELGAQEGKG